MDARHNESDSAPPADGGLITVQVKTMDSKVHMQSIDGSSTVLELKNSLVESTTVGSDRQRLIYRGRVLEDEKFLNEYNIEEGQMLHMIARPANFSSRDRAATVGERDGTQQGGNTGVVGESGGGFNAATPVLDYLFGGGAGGAARGLGPLSGLGALGSLGGLALPRTLATNASRGSASATAGGQSTALDTIPMEPLWQGLCTLHTLLSVTSGRTLSSRERQFMDNTRRSISEESSSSQEELTIDARSDESFGEMGSLASLNEQSSPNEAALPVANMAEDTVQDSNDDTDPNELDIDITQGVVPPSSPPRSSEQQQQQQQQQPSSPYLSHNEWQERIQRDQSRTTAQMETEISRLEAEPSNSDQAALLAASEVNNNRGSSETPVEPLWTSDIEYYEGQWVDVKDTVHQWLEATIMEVDRTQRRVFVHYNAWPNNWDEWLSFDSTRIAPFRTRTRHTSVSGRFLSPEPVSAVSTAPRAGPADDYRLIIPEIARMMRRVQPIIDEAANIVEASAPPLSSPNEHTTGGRGTGSSSTSTTETLPVQTPTSSSGSGGPPTAAITIPVSHSTSTHSTRTSQPPVPEDRLATITPWGSSTFMSSQGQNRTAHTTTSLTSSSTVDGTETTDELNNVTNTEEEGQSSQRLVTLSDELCPLLDRLGRVLTDFAPHLRNAADTQLYAPTPTQNQGETDNTGPSSGGSTSTTASPTTTNSSGAAAPSVSAANSPLEQLALASILRPRPPSPQPQRTFRQPIVSSGPGGSGSAIDIHVSILHAAPRPNQGGTTGTTTSTNGSTSDQEASVLEQLSSLQNLLQSHTSAMQSSSASNRQQQNANNLSDPLSQRLHASATSGNLSTNTQQSVDDNRNNNTDMSVASLMTPLLNSLESRRADSRSDLTADSSTNNTTVTRQGHDNADTRQTNNVSDTVTDAANESNQSQRRPTLARRISRFFGF